MQGFALWSLLPWYPSGLLLDTLNRSGEFPVRTAGAPVLKLNDAWHNRLLSDSSTVGSVQEAGRLSLRCLQTISQCRGGEGSFADKIRHRIDSGNQTIAKVPTDFVELPPGTLNSSDRVSAACRQQAVMEPSLYPPPSARRGPAA